MFKTHYFHLLVLLGLFALLAACASSQRQSTAPVKINSPSIHSTNSRNTNSRYTKSNRYTKSGYICGNASSYKDKRVGTGHCVSLIQTCSAAPLTALWKQGPSVKGAALSPGTIIATFKGGKYPNRTGWHAAIYISQDEKGIWVWDQWVGKPVHKRLIRFKNGKGSANNDGDAYSVVY